MKTCTRCGKEKPDTEFRKKCGRCKHCLYLENLDWRAKNKDKVSNLNSKRYDSHYSKTVILPPKEKPEKEIKESKPKKIKVKRQKPAKVQMTIVKSKESRYIKLVAHDWDKKLRDIKQQVKKWEEQQV